MNGNVKKIYPIPLEINWHEGMLLSQHHFQQNDLRNFRVLASQIRLLSSNHYGVRHLRIDTVSLSDGLYRIKELEAVFPDGLTFSFFPEKYQGLKSLEIDIKSHMDPDTNDATIFLALAESLDNVSPILGNPPRYYSLDGEIVQDDNIKENTVRIPRLFPNAFLYIGNSLPEFCIGFPLCKVLKLDGVFRVKNWTPPCFFIERHFPLWQRCEALTISLREKAVYLSDKIRNSSSEELASDSTHILKQLVTILPGIEALIYSNEIRPYELYQELAEILGAVAVLIPTDIIPIMRPYDHSDIDGCLYWIIDLIEHYISTIERGFQLLAFNKKEKFFYRYVSLDDLNRASNNKLYIGIKTDEVESYNDIEFWVKNAVIVSDFAIDMVRTKRTSGAQRMPAKREIISKILPGVGVYLFEVEIDNNYIRPEQNLHIFNPSTNSKIYPSEIILYLPRSKK